MNLRNNKGYTAVDASIAILILLIVVPTITGMIFNVNKTNNYIDKKTEAISIAVNAIETVKGIDILTLIDDPETEESEPLIAVANELEEIYDPINEEGEDDTEISDLNIDNPAEMILTKNENTYKVEITIADYSETDEGKAISAQSGYVKDVKVIVTFRSGQQLKKVELSTVIS